MVESGLFSFFSRLAQAYVWTRTKAFYQSCTLRFLEKIVFASQTSFRQCYTKCQKLRDKNLRGERLNLLPTNFLQALDSEERISPDSLCDYESKPICGVCKYPDNSLNILEPKNITPKIDVEKTNSGKS